MIKLNGVEIKLDKYPDGTFLFKDIPPIGGWCRDNIEWTVCLLHMNFQN